MVAKKITSLQHPLIKHWVSLRLEKTYREEAKRVLISGKNMVKEIPRETLITVEPSDFRAKETYLVTEEIMQKITGLKSTDGFAAEVAMPKPQELEDKPFLLILDKLADPGNLGTLIRTALAFKWDGIVLTPGTVDLFNDKTIRASQGAIFRLPYMHAIPEEIVRWKRRFFTADLDGKSLSDATFKEPLALILSNEGNGPGDWSFSISEKITIPMSKKVESLNVAVSGAILLYTMGPK